MRHIILLGVCALITGCGNATEIYKSKTGPTYVVERLEASLSENLPTNNDLKMVDADLARYAADHCGLDLSDPPQRCDLYVQPDPSGTLVGYAFVQQRGSQATISTSVLAGEGMGDRRPCYIDGALQVANVAADFDARIMYSAWERDPGVYLVTEVKPDDDGEYEGALGVWYLSKVGNKLRLTQERWNYCADDAFVDDVFYQAVTLTRQ